MMTLEKGLEMRRRNPAQGPWGTIHHLLGTTRVAVAAGHLVTARDLLRDLGARMDRYDEGMRAMRARMAAVQELLRERPQASGPGEALTDRELDVLRLLQGSLSLGDIARELFLSTNTVKTHAHAIYRKLDAHSRDEAVRAARRNQLI
jgi:LuxR family maltose regulon positive regulatory protein